MPTRNVVLTPHQNELIDQLVDTGRYQNASEVLRYGLRLVEREETDHADKVARLRAAIQIGIDAADRGDVTRFETFEDLDAHLAELAEETLRR